MNPAQAVAAAPQILVPLIAPVQNPQQTRQARRLYIGNIPAGITEQELMDFFNTAMVNLRPQGHPNTDTKPIMSVQINHEKSFAFIELRTITDATAGMMLDGIMLKGQSLKVRRPKDYQPLPGETVKAIDDDTPAQPLPNIVSTNVPDSPNKIFIGGLPSYLNEEQVKELLSSFGQLKAFNLVKDSVTGNSKGYAFFEYIDSSVTDRACAGLNTMKLGEKTLLVQRASIGAKNPYPDPSTTNTGNMLGLGGLTIPMNSSPPIPTRILVLLNIITADDLRDDEDYEEIYTDILNECKKHGNLLSLLIPRPQVDSDQAEEVFAPGVGRIFVEYSSEYDAQNAQKNLAGRKYNARICITSYLLSSKYEKRELD